MITLKDFMEVTNYRITEGSRYCWDCFGSDAYSLDSWNGDIDGHSIGVVFDTKTQVVYQAVAYDYVNERAYRITNPDYAEAHLNETKYRGVLDVAWEKDDSEVVNYVDLDVDEDFLIKARAIVAGEEYDTRVSIAVDMPDDLVFELMKMAHQRDITFNQLVEEILIDEIQRIELAISNDKEASIKI
jgi:hypothetical protein